ncbi:MAG: aminotransferase class V-fold PLP-dependent enzyme [Xanthomonadales bacterium]|nr:aminotransferase class V-fold PLP-dependent enzyme [Xanthomonadales bacterium]
MARQWGREFPLDPGLIYLNHAAVGPWPIRTAEAIKRFVAQNLNHACTDFSLWKEAETVRTRLARMLGAEVDDIAIVKNTSEAVSFVAMGLTFEPGENVVLPDCEFPSNRSPWQALEDRGVEVRLVDAAPEDRARALIEACDARTRLVAASTVQYDDGAQLDVAALAGFCRDRPILLFLDAIQSLGVLPLDVAALGVDFVAGGSHKWLLAPEGVGYFFARPEARSQLALQQRGWRMNPSPFSFGRGDRQPAKTAHRFEPGTLNTLGMIGLEASLSLLEEIGIAAVSEQILANSRFLIEELDGTPGLKLVTPRHPEWHAGIVSFTLQNDPKAALRLFGHLKQQGIYAAERSGFLRLSPHFHTPREQLEITVSAIRAGLKIL